MQPNSKPVSALGSLKRMFIDMTEAVKNLSFAWLFAGQLMMFVMIGVDNALNLYMNTFFWELSSVGCPPSAFDRQMLVM